MTGGKRSSKDKKKRRRSSSRDPGSQGERKRRTTEPSYQEPESSAPCVSVKEEEEVEELSDIEEGGLDLNVPLKPISFYISNRKEMLEHCFHVLGDKKLKKMLPDMLKDLPLDEIKQLCLEQVEIETEDNLLKIIQGETGMDSAVEDHGEGHVTFRSGLSSQDNLGLEDVDAKVGKGEDYDALSINADTFDSDIEGPSFEERNPDPSIPTVTKVAGESDDLVMDIEKSVNEILGLAEPVEDIPPVAAVVLPEDIHPSAQQLELLELEMRARAIKALMKASDVKKT
ncbi:caspase activity and apoptosis inhibitor 1 [Gastrophryne carolinensis]